MLIPSMKYSVSALSSSILALLAKILNSAIYSSTDPFPCRNCLSLARASPSVSAAENAFLISSTKSLSGPKSLFGFSKTCWT